MLALLAASPLAAQSTSSDTVLRIDGAVATPFAVTRRDVNRLARRWMIKPPADGLPAVTFGGIPLSVLLRRAGSPSDPAIVARSYLLATSSDGGRVLFALAEIDSLFSDRNLLIADELEHMALSGGDGPLWLIAPFDDRRARWLKHVNRLTVVTLGTSE